MKDLIEPPDYLSDIAKRAFLRISRKLDQYGKWDDLDLGYLALASMSCEQYLEYAKSAGVSDPELACKRIVIRRMLSDFLYISQDRIYLSEINSAGLDIDIANLCAPETKSFTLIS
ncbi:MAG: hypothetical protein ACJA2Q_002275 [Pseudohongiellaceae bacterium]|jgi:hypothetical protein